MSDRDSRAAWNWLLQQEKSGRLAMFLIVTATLGMFIAPTATSDRVEQQRGQERAEERTPMTTPDGGLPDQGTIDLMLNAGWDLYGGQLVPPGCRSAP